MALIDKLTAIADGFRERDGTTEKLSLTQMAILARQGGGYIEDLPSTPGQWACLARASQMRDIVLNAQGTLPSAGGSYETLEPNNTKTGIWYSSTRGTDWFIGYAVSMYSLLTAVNNPKSILYTKTYQDYFAGGGGIVENVYGTNCSEYVSYCFDLPYLVVTNRLPYLECMVDETGTHNPEGMYWNTETDTMDIDKLRKGLGLCDCLNGTSAFGSGATHAILVTGIRRDENGLIQEVDISESWPPRIKVTTYKWSDFVSRYIESYQPNGSEIGKYRAYRCSELDKVRFPENLTNIEYGDICTSRGDKVCIRADQDISLNVLNISDYTGIALFKDGVQVNTHTITADSPDWELTDLTTGKYTAILYKSGEDVTVDSATLKNSTNFMVCEVSVNRNGATYTYTAEAINGVYPKPMQIAIKNSIGYTLNTQIFGDVDFSGSGSAEFVENSSASIIHVPFKTEYGFVIAENGY